MPPIRRRLRLFGVQQDREIVFDGEMSQLDAVEVRVRTRTPQTAADPLPAPEREVFDDEDVDVDRFRRDLERRGLALIVVRDATTRDRHDRQQPFNLRVAGSTHGSDTGDGALFDVAHLQLFQADLLAGYTFRDGRRPLAVPLHSLPAATHPPSEVPPGADARSFRPLHVDDGSVAALVPARRALSWQLTDGDGFALVRERYWVTFQPGELRVCSSCHGLNGTDQLGRPPPENAPEALRELLRWWKAHPAGPFRDGFES